MRSTILTLVLGASLLAPGQPPQSPAAASARPAPLAVFAPLIGHDWQAALPGGQVTDIQRYDWIYGGKFVRNTHRVRTQAGEVVYEGETVYAWDARASRMTWWYWNSTGGFVTGTATVTSDGSILSEGENHGPADQLDRSRSLVRIGRGEWTMTSAQARNDQWTEQPARVYRLVN